MHNDPNDKENILDKVKDEVHLLSLDFEMKQYIIDYNKYN